MDPSEALTLDVENEVEKLRRHFDRITSCRVMIEAPHRHHRNGDAYHVRIEVHVPGRELVVGHDGDGTAGVDRGHREAGRQGAGSAGRHADVYVAVSDAFEAVRRQLQQYAQRLRHEVKAHGAAEFPMP